MGVDALHASHVIMRQPVEGKSRRKRKHGHYSLEGLPVSIITDSTVTYAFSGIFSWNNV